MEHEEYYIVNENLDIIDSVCFCDKCVRNRAGICEMHTNRVTENDYCLLWCDDYQCDLNYFFK